MSLDAALARVSLIESALDSPAALAARATATTGGVGLSPVSAAAGADGTGPNAFGTQLAKALTTGDGSSVVGSMAAPAGSAGPAGLQGSPLISPSGMATSPLSGLAAGALGSPATGTSAGQEMVRIAESQIGQAEQPPGSNDSAAIATYRTATSGAMAGEPWCAYFASWVARQAGEPLGESGQGYGYVGDIWSWAQRSGRAIPNGPGVTPTPGDLIIFGDHHVGIVDKVLPNGSIETVEGNYSNQVSQVIRGAGEATGYVRM